MGNMMDNIKTKGAEMKGEVENAARHLKDDITGKDYGDVAAQKRGENQARNGVVGAAEREAANRAADQKRDGAIPRKPDGSVDTKAAELRGQARNEMKHQNKEEEKGFKKETNRIDRVNRQ